MARQPLRIAVKQKDRNELKGMLSGGIQQVRVTLRAIALTQLAQDVPAPRIAAVVTMCRTPAAMYQYESAGVEPAQTWDPCRPESSTWPTNAAKRATGFLFCIPSFFASGRIRRLIS
jgi:hypothetical protein